MTRTRQSSSPSILPSTLSCKIRARNLACHSYPTFSSLAGAATTTVVWLLLLPDASRKARSLSLSSCSRRLARSFSASSCALIYILQRPQ